jgi:hypothetical protein
VVDSLEVWLTSYTAASIVPVALSKAMILAVSMIDHNIVHSYRKKYGIPLKLVFSVILQTHSYPDIMYLVAR